jgi:transcriptional regulator with XRE-family HTH domain
MQLRTTNEWLQELGHQIRRARIAAEMTQSDLALRADIALSAVRKLEGGGGSSLITLVACVRALGLTSWLETLCPDTGPSPMALLKHASKAPRQRVRHAMKLNTTTAG